MISAWIGSFGLLLAAILYILLALGLPYGEFAMGGKYKVMPKSFRIVCAAGTIAQLFAILILLQVGNVISIGLSNDFAKSICFFFAIYFTLNVILNAFSQSKKEKYIITPLSIVVTVCFWLTLLNK